MRRLCPWVLGTSVILRRLRGARRLEGDLDLDHLISGFHAAGYLSLRRLFLNLAYRPMPVCPLVEPPRVCLFRLSHAAMAGCSIMA